MWNFLKKILGIEHSLGSPGTDPSIQKLVNFNALNRRKNIRVRYPHFGAFGPYPRISYMDCEMIVGNVSVGGLLIIDDTEKLGSNVGEVINIEIAWDDFKAKVRARIVGATLHKRHLQFVDFNAQVFLRLSQLVKPAYLGSRFHRVRDEIGQVRAKELWIGPTNESLTFGKNAIHLAELILNGDKIVFQRATPTLFANTGAPIPAALLYDILVIVANLPEATPRVKDLLEVIEVELRALKARKAG